MKKPQTVIFLIRHGQTDLAPTSDPSADKERVLTEEGRGQIEKVGEYLRSFAPSAIYSSPLKRTLQTAEIINEVAEIPAEITLEAVLVEMYYGKDQGYHERAADVHNFFEGLITQHAGQQVVLVSHQDPIEAFLEHMDFNTEELAEPCKMGQGYRLVLAGNVPVECQKINPAGV